MFDDTTQRPCPHCGRSINWAATRCGYCWLPVSPLTRDEAADAAIPYSNHGEALRLAKERDSAAIEALLNERDRLHEEAVETKTNLAAITGEESSMRASAAWEDDGAPAEGVRTERNPAGRPGPAGNRSDEREGTRRSRAEGERSPAVR
jgi:hypothetical protein